MAVKTILIILISLIAAAIPGHTFTLNNTASAHFYQDEVLIDMADASCNNIGITRDELWELTIEGMNRYWNSVPTSRLRMKKGSLISVDENTFKNTPVCATNNPCLAHTDMIFPGNIVIGCSIDSINFPGPTILALTLPNNFQNRNIISAIILVNDQITSRFSTLSRSEMVAVMAHEVGHAIGLGHSEVRDSLMYYMPIITRTNLGQDDFDGVNYLYPKKVRALGLSCGNIEELGKGGGGGTNFNINMLLGFIFVVFLQFFLDKLSLLSRKNSLYR